MALLLHHDGGREVLASQRQTIRQQFNYLQENLLLFLGNLGEIQIDIFDDDHRQETSTIFSKGKMDSGQVALTKTVTKGGEETTD